MSTPLSSESTSPSRRRIWLTVLGVASTGAMGALVVGLVAGTPGCTTSSTPNVSASTGGSPSPDPTPASGGGKAGALPDLTKEFESGNCEEVQGAKVPGADSYFHGEFKVAGESATGSETWWLHANEAWTARGGSSCTIRWSVRGIKTEQGACRDCDFGLQLTASPEVGASGCPEDLLKREAKPQDLHYDIKLSSNGDAYVYFAKSGKLLGQGFHKDGTIVYRTQHQCKWF